MQAVKMALRRYGMVQGRAGRAEFWLFALACETLTLAISLPLLLIWGTGEAAEIALMPAGGAQAPPFIETLRDVAFLHAPFVWLSIPLGMPFMAVLARRLHDAGFSAWLAAPALFFGILSVLTGSNVLFIMGETAACNPNSALAAGLDVQLALWKVSSGAIALAFACLLALLLKPGQKHANQYGSPRM